MTIFYVTILAIATFIWGWVFYKKEYHPQPLRVIALSFIAGMLSMLPLFGYKHIYTHYLPQISEFRILEPLLQYSIINGLFIFLVNIALIFFMLTFMLSIITLILTRFQHETLENIHSTLKDDEVEFVTMSSMLAILVYGETLFEHILDKPIVYSTLGVILFLAVIEEYVKHLTVRFVDDKKIKDIDDAITLSIIVGLAFAFIETIIYGFYVGDLALLVPRALLSMPIHIIASGTFGYYYGMALFAEDILKAEKEEKKYQIKFKWFHSVLKFKKSDIFEEEKIGQGLVMATIYHTIFNLLLELNLAYVTIPLITVGILILSYYYKESHIIYRLLNKRH